MTARILGTRRRAQALAALGHDVLTLAEWFDVHPRYVQDLLRGPLRRVPIEVHRRVDTVYERNCMLTGTCRHTRRAAEAEGWAPPLAWDEGVLDDPAAGPNPEGHGAVEVDPVVDEALVWKVLNRALRWPPGIGLPRQPAREWKDARAEAMRRLAKAGQSDQRIAEHLGFNIRTIQRARAEYGIPPGVPAGGLGQALSA